MTRPYDLNEIKIAADAAAKDGGYYEADWTYVEWALFNIDGPEASHIAAASPWAVRALVEAVEAARALVCEGHRAPFTIAPHQARVWADLELALRAFDSAPGTGASSPSTS